jgi:hypothetical protein
MLTLASSNPKSRLMSAYVNHLIKLSDIFMFYNRLVMLVMLFIILVSAFVGVFLQTNQSRIELN